MAKDSFSPSDVQLAYILRLVLVYMPGLTTCIKPFDNSAWLPPFMYEEVANDKRQWILAINQAFIVLYCCLIAHLGQFL